MNNKDIDITTTTPTTAETKDDKRNKSVRKKDRFWKLLFSNPQLQPLKKQQHKKSSSMGSNNSSFFFSSRLNKQRNQHNDNSNGNNTAVKRTQDQLCKINTIAKYAQNNISVSLEPEVFEYILESNSWDTKKSLADLVDYEEASHGILVEPPFATTYKAHNSNTTTATTTTTTTTTSTSLLGSENDGGTSCYIDALLFAMYISNTAFDPLLTYDIPSKITTTTTATTVTADSATKEIIEEVEKQGDFVEKNLAVEHVTLEDETGTKHSNDEEEDDEINEESEKKIKLQTLMRLFVNKLRKGHFVNADYVHWFRKVLEEAKWNGRDENGQWTQEDASELFLFITETFDLPYLPFQIRLFHGANRDSDDDRVMTDRTLTLSIPEHHNEESKLQDILLDYFYNNIITGIKRQVDNNNNNSRRLSLNFSENVAKSPTIQKRFLEEEAKKDEKYELKQMLEKTAAAEEQHQQQQAEHEVAVTAWQVLELLPFYSAMNEQGEAIRTQLDSSFPDTHMILPIVLKRYRYDSHGGSVKIKKKVEIPVTIDFNKFVNQNIDDPMCSTCGHEINWTLYFKSAVCHKGDSPYSGHYISYARIHDATNFSSTHDNPSSNSSNAKYKNENYFWLKFDDMNLNQRVQKISDEDSQSVYTDLAENAYIIFYELDKTCHHNLRKIGTGTTLTTSDTISSNCTTASSTSTNTCSSHSVSNSTSHRPSINEKVSQQQQHHIQFDEASPPEYQLHRPSDCLNNDIRYNEEKRMEGSNSHGVSNVVVKEIRREHLKSSATMSTFETDTEEHHCNCHEKKKLKKKKKHRRLTSIRKHSRSSSKQDESQQPQIAENEAATVVDNTDTSSSNDPTHQEHPHHYHHHHNHHDSQHHHHNHHHHKYHLKDSCNIM